jgi:hypothetical protein
MLLKNAPERKRECQSGALERLKIKLARGSHLTENAKRRIAKEIKVLEKRTEYSRRGIRTKKTRSI